MEMMGLFDTFLLGGYGGMANRIEHLLIILCITMSIKERL